MRYFEDCDLDFPKLVDARPTPLVALILSYKKSTNTKEKRRGQTVIKERNRETKQEKNKDQERELAIATKDSRRTSSGSHSYFLFSYFYLITMNYLMPKTILFLILLQIMN